MPLVAVGELSAAVRPQDRDGVLVQGDGPAPGCGLWFTFDDGVAGRGALAFDEQQAPVEVDGRPPQAAKLAAAQAA
ncbi:hypothetical protein [Actinoplanes philippinensis]|uniref:hypothetical protein n=1 Tax=Actinoplanes philippinensis TaxID=35752 RepID=UPI0033C76844